MYKTFKRCLKKILPNQIVKFIKNIIYLLNFEDNINRLESKLDRTLLNTNILIRYNVGVINRGERYLFEHYNQAPADHLDRYKLSSSYIKQDDIVLDFACGCGYGSSYLNDHTEAKHIIGADLSAEIVEYANKFFKNSVFVWVENRVKFQQGDISVSTTFDSEQFNKIISFETIEHLPDGLDTTAIKNVYNWLKPSGIFITSVPDKELHPYDRKEVNFSPFHFRHYTNIEFKSLLEQGGFTNIELGYINFHTNTLVKECTKECYSSIIAVCIK